VARSLIVTDRSWVRVPSWWLVGAMATRSRFSKAPICGAACAGHASPIRIQGLSDGVVSWRGWRRA